MCVSAQRRAGRGTYQVLPCAPDAGGARTVGSMKRRIGVCLVALGIITSALGGVLAAPAGAVTCANPTTLNGYEGTIQYPGSLFVQQNVWTQQGAQTMHVCGPSEWDAVANQSGEPASGVKTYPDTSATLTDWSTCDSAPTIGALKTMRGTYGNVPPTDLASYDYAWDLFIGGGPCANDPFVEVMVWTHWNDVDVPTAQLHPTIGKKTYDFYHAGSYMQFRQQVQTDRGTTPLKQVLKYLVKQGLVSASGHVLFAQYGPEILTTFGQDVTFGINRFSVSTTLK